MFDTISSEDVDGLGIREVELELPGNWVRLSCISLAGGIVGPPFLAKVISVPLHWSI